MALELWRLSGRGARSPWEVLQGEHLDFDVTVMRAAENYVETRMRLAYAQMPREGGYEQAMQYLAEKGLSEA